MNAAHHLENQASPASGRPRRTKTDAWDQAPMAMFTASPRMGVVPVAMMGEKQRHWSFSYRCPEAYKLIDQWCARNRHPDMVACLAHLHQQMRLMMIKAVASGYDARLATKTLLAPRRVKSHRRHRSWKTKNRLAIINRQLRMLSAIGLAKRGRGWFEFVDVSERIADLRSLIYPSVYNEFRICYGQKRDVRQFRSQKNGHRLELLRGGRGAHAKAQRRVVGRFAPRPPDPEPTFRPEAGQQAAQPSAAPHAVDPACFPPFGEQNPPCNPEQPSLQADPTLQVAPAAEEGLQGEDLPNSWESCTTHAELSRYAAWVDEQQGGEQSEDRVVAFTHHFGRICRERDPEAYGATPAAESPVRSPAEAANNFEGHGIHAAPKKALQELSLQKLGVIAELRQARPDFDPTQAVNCTGLPAPKDQLADVLYDITDPKILDKMAARGYCLMAWWHAKGHVEMSNTRWRCPQGALIYAAQRYNAWFQGRADGWSPYAALVRNFYRAGRRPQL